MRGYNVYLIIYKTIIKEEVKEEVSPQCYHSSFLNTDGFYDPLVNFKYVNVCML